VSRTPARPAVRTGRGRWIALGALLVGVALGVIGALPAVSPAAVMSGKLTGVRLVTESDVGLVRAVRLPDLAVQDAGRTSRRGKYRLRLGSGRYVVVGTVASGRALAPSLALAVVRVRGRRAPRAARLCPKRLKGFEPSAFCMASSSSDLEISTKCLQIGRYQRASRRRGLPGMPLKYRGLDKERTMRVRPNGVPRVPRRERRDDGPVRAPSRSPGGAPGQTRARGQAGAGPRRPGRDRERFWLQRRWRLGIAVLVDAAPSRLLLVPVLLRDG
jgi:hypothetical protein